MVGRTSVKPTRKFGKTGSKPQDHFKSKQVVEQLINADPTLRQALKATDPAQAPARRIVLTK